MSRIFQITALAFPTFLKRLASAVRSRTAANGDSTGFDVRGMLPVLRAGIGNHSYQPLWSR